MSWALAAVKLPPGSCAPLVDLWERSAMIAEAACFRSRRHPDGGVHDIEAWLAAEREIDAKLELAARLK
jgi:hypothetical protein